MKIIIWIAYLFFLQLLSGVVLMASFKIIGDSKLSAIISLTLCILVFIGGIILKIKYSKKETKKALNKTLEVKKAYDDKPLVINANSTDTVPKGYYRKSLESIDCLISGSQFKSSDGSIREKYISILEEYDPLDVKFEPDNEYDKNAVLILDKNGNDLGYIPKRYNTTVANHIKEGNSVTCTFKKKYKKEGYLNGVVYIDIHTKELFKKPL